MEAHECESHKSSDGYSVYSLYKCVERLPCCIGSNNKQYQQHGPAGDNFITRRYNWLYETEKAKIAVNIHKVYDVAYEIIC